MLEFYDENAIHYFYSVLVDMFPEYSVLIHRDNPRPLHLNESTSEESTSNETVNKYSVNNTLLSTRIINTKSRMDVNNVYNSFFHHQFLWL